MKGYYVICKGTATWVYNKKKRAYVMDDKNIEYGVVKNYES